MVGNWWLANLGARADLWESNDGKWKFSYYRASGDYHIKGKSGARAKSERGLFNGEPRRVAASHTIGEEMDAQYSDWVSHVLPGYAG